MTVRSYLVSVASVVSAASAASVASTATGASYLRSMRFTAERSKRIRVLSLVVSRTKVSSFTLTTLPMMPPMVVTSSPTARLFLIAVASFSCFLWGRIMKKYMITRRTGKIRRESKLPPLPPVVVVLPSRSMGYKLNMKKSPFRMN